MTPAEQVAWERETAPRAAMLGVLAALLPLAGKGLLLAALTDRTRISIVDALANTLGPGEKANPGLKSFAFLFNDAHAGALLLAFGLIALGAAAGGLFLAHLARVVAGRREELPRVAPTLALVGGIVFALASFGAQVALSIKAGDLADAADKTNKAVEDALRTPAIIVPAILQLLSAATLAVAFILVSLNAIRAGLLSRFMGYVGVFVGVLTLIPIGSPLPVVQTFWLLAVVALILDRWPGGRPEAWATGTSVPWPSAVPPRARAQAPADPEAAELEAPAGTPHPSSKKRKRKRR